MGGEQEKTCTKCEASKPLDEFSADRNQCKECRRAYHREHDKTRSLRPERIAAIRSYARSDTALAAAARYRDENPERWKEIQRRSYEKNREARLKAARDYREQNPTYQSEWAARNPEKVRATWTRSNQLRRARARSLPSEPVSKRVSALRDGPHCWMCGVEVTEYDRDHFDHLIPLAADPDALAALGVENPGTVQANMSFTCAPCGGRKTNRAMMCAVARYLRNSERVNPCVELVA